MPLPSARDLVLSVKDLPSPPTVYMRLSELIADDAWNARDVASLIGADPAIATRLLRLANSPFYATPRSVASLDEAVVLLGESEIRSLVLATTVMERFNGIPAELICTETLRRRSLYCGLAASNLASESFDRAGRAELFLAGLVLDIGSLVVCMRLPEAVLEAGHAGRIPEEAGGPSIECALTGSNLTLVGAELLSHWRLPQSVVEAVRWARVPWEANVYRQHAAIVHIASRLSAPLARKAPGEASQLSIDDDAWHIAGLRGMPLDSLVARLEAAFESVSTLVGAGVARG